MSAVRPEPTEEEAAAIAAALEVLWPRATTVEATDEVPRWRWSGRWWSRPVPLSRTRP